jgi:hypothetical protein
VKTTCGYLARNSIIGAGSAAGVYSMYCLLNAGIGVMRFAATP